MFRSQFEVRDKMIGDGQPPYVIAEMACAHDGDLGKATALVDAAAAAGADAIQVQLFAVDHQVAPQHPLHELLCTLAFPAGEWATIFAHARQYEMALFAFTYDTPSLELALELGIDGIKLSSADLSNPEMTAAAARSGLPITLGTGASTLDEISAALRNVERHGGERVVLMHGVQNFPTALEDANLRRIALLRRVFRRPVGYQDHTDAATDVSKVIDLAALGLGACIVEKHITPDRSQQGTDYQAALEPVEFAQWVTRIRQVAQALGTDAVTPLTESDRKYRRFQKKSIVAARALAPGETLARADVTFLRQHDAPGLAPAALPQLLGKPTRRAIAQFERIGPSDVVEA